MCHYVYYVMSVFLDKLNSEQAHFEQVISIFMFLLMNNTDVLYMQIYSEVFGFF